MRRFGYVLSLVVLLVPAAPAFADDEALRLEMPSSAPAGDVISIRGNCSGDGPPKIVSEAFVGGEATLSGPGRFSGSAQIVAQPGEYPVKGVCGAMRLTSRTFTVR